jgi:hypothetical protein
MDTEVLELLLSPFSNHSCFGPGSMRRLMTVFPSSTSSQIPYTSLQPGRPLTSSLTSYSETLTTW